MLVALLDDECLVFAFQHFVGAVVWWRHLKQSLLLLSSAAEDAASKLATLAAVRSSRDAITCACFVTSWVIPRRVNWASACKNQALAFKWRGGGCTRLLWAALSIAGSPV